MTEVSRAQGVLVGRLADVGMAVCDQASLAALTKEVVKTSEIEGETLNVESVRSSIARRLGVDIGALAPVDRHVEGIVEMVLDATTPCAAPLTAERAFITENETNFLASLPVARAIVIFGAGYGWEALGRAAWLRRCALRHWGDIDTHGFAILDQLRGHFPNTASFLMNRETLLAHRLQWGEEPEPARHDLARFTMEEAALYDELRFDRIQPRLRLEQERLGFGWVCQRLDRL